VIPFASQRAGGQDLATHLLNEHDNEHIEALEVRGAIACDLHGAFAEWEAQANALTRCRQYLCSLSINPDELQGRLTRAQYLDYIERAEEKLGLKGQPRAVIFHIKEDERGRMREHCHVVWSRVDAKAGKAVQLSFFKEKLMTVTREFARDHGLTLPDGYRRHEEKLLRRNRQLSGYDCIKQKATGVSHEQRMAAVTGAWKRSDSGKAFVNALEDLGYVLARGRNESRLVVVDIYGHTTALTRLIDDPAVKARQVREFLGPDYAPENLRSVEQAQALGKERRQAIESFEKARAESEKVAALKAQQAERRANLGGQAAFLKVRQREELAQLAAEQKSVRQHHKTQYLAQARRIRVERAQRSPKGLAAFLGRVTGVALITKKVQRYRDRKRLEAHLAERQDLARAQREQQQALARRHELQGADMQRRLRALDQIEERERKGLEQARTKEHRQRINARHEHMPVFTLELKPPGRKAAPHKAKNRFISPLARELAEAARERQERRKIKLADAFERAAREESGEAESGGGASGGPQPPPEPRIKHQNQRKVDLSREFNDAAANSGDAGGDGGLTREPDGREPEDDGPGNDRPRRPRRPRTRDLDRGR
jgi:hypothetical protein